jgi:hypothetical protein
VSPIVAALDHPEVSLDPQSVPAVALSLVAVEEKGSEVHPEPQAAELGLAALGDHVGVVAVRANPTTHRGHRPTTSSRWTPTPREAAGDHQGDEQECRVPSRGPAYR